CSTHDNLDEIVPLAEFIRSTLLVDGHYFNLIRGDAKDPALKRIEREKLRCIYPRLAEIQWSYAEGMFDDRNRFLKWIKKAAYVGTLTFHHRTQFQNLETRTPWAMACNAGERAASSGLHWWSSACEWTASE